MEKHKIDQMVDEAKEYTDLKTDQLRLMLIENLSLLMGKSLAVIIAIMLALIALVILVCLIVSLLAEAVGLIWSLVIVLVVLSLGAFLILRSKDKLFTNTMVEMFVKMFYPDKSDTDETKQQ